MTGETLSGLTGGSFTNCSPESNNAILDFQASGAAVGPFPGTFLEQGHVEVQGGVVTQFHSEFTIFSGETTITGTKDLDVTGASFAICVVQHRVIVTAEVTYEAEISTPLGTFHDEGTSVVTTGSAPTVFLETFESDVLVTTPGQITGGGWITMAANTVSFGLNAQSDGTADTTMGNCSVVDHATQAHIKCLTVDALVVAGTHATIAGQASVDGVPTNYRIDIDDLGEPGITDTFKIETDHGYTAAGTLDGGNIQIHK